MDRNLTKFTTLFLLLLFILTGCGVTTPPPPVSPVIGDQITITVDSASYNLRYLSGKAIFTGYQDDGTTTVTSKYWIAETELTYEVWAAVYTWAIGHNYYFANPGVQGDSGSGNNQQPVTTICWRDALVWCNALTEYCNDQNGMSLDCVYTYSGNIIRDSRASNATACDNASVNSAAKGFRLPSADEWELAARYINDSNGDGDIMDAGEYYPGDHVSGDVSGYCYSGGQSASASTIYGNYAWYSETATQPVGGKLANTLGIFDMSGNVFEFCFDWLPGFTGTHRLMRGGAFNAGPYQELDLGYNGAGLGPADKTSNCGFRVVKND